ncbi:MAG: SPOR domain-containing protein [Acidobacteriota bacterium]
MSQHDEPSYYEIALTTRQVVVFFVVLLIFVVATFLSGVWVGKSGRGRLADAGGGTPRTQVASTEGEALDNIEELRFFDENEGGEGAPQPPDLSEILENPRPDTTLAQDVGSQRAAEPQPAEAPDGPSRPQRQEAPPSQASAPPPSSPPPSSQPTSSPPRQATAPPPSPPPPAQARPAAPAGSAEGFVIQVFSTRDEPQARRVLEQLRGGGHRAFLSPVDVDGTTMYRVRVGPFGERAEADRVAQRVTREMRLDTWVTAADN